MVRKRTKEKGVYDTQLNELKEGVIRRSNELLEEKIPNKIRELQVFLKNDLPKLFEGYEKYATVEVNMSNKVVKEGPAKKKRKLDDSKSGPTKKDKIPPWRKKAPRSESELARLKTHVQCNRPLTTAISKIQQHIKNFVDVLGDLKFSVSLRVPKMEDGNNMGVQVQEEVLAELTQIEERCFNALEEFTKYFEDRGKLISKILKWPQIEDWRSALREFDKKAVLELKCYEEDCINDYTVVLDLMTKNIDKLRKPRGSFASLAY